VNQLSNLNLKTAKKHFILSQMITNAISIDKSNDLFESFRNSIQLTKTFKQPHVVVVLGASVAKLF
jgi:hypothetical protein